MGSDRYQEYGHVLVCKEPGCYAWLWALGWCRGHWWTWVKHGDPQWKKPREKPVYTEKTCTQCPKTKPLDDFYRDPRNLDGRESRCADCHRADQRARYHARSGSAA
jgi:hypothetical protein